jgi:hypothetical protein
LKALRILRGKKGDGVMSVFRLPAHILSTELEGEGLLVDLNEKKYYLLNETAFFVWTRLEDGKDIEEIAEAITSMYDASAELALSSVESVVSDLRSRRILT